MKLAHRSPLKVMSAVMEPRHYQAFFRMWRDSGDFGKTLRQYLTGKGSYPCSFSVKTPLGTIAPRLYSYYDLLTLNEIFFRMDYPSSSEDRVIVDLGSNIGLSALFFLTRSEYSRCYLYEPDPRNVERLKENLAAFQGRYEIHAQAVADEAGTLRFGLDMNSGRYGGLKVDFGASMMVECLHINNVLGGILNRHKVVDVLKIDTEGTEIQTIQAIDPAILRKIRKIYVEAEPKQILIPDFDQKQTGTVCQFFNRYHPIEA